MHILISTLYTVCDMDPCIAEWPDQPSCSVSLVALYIPIFRMIPRAADDSKEWD